MVFKFNIVMVISSLGIYSISIVFGGQSIPATTQLVDFLYYAQYSKCEGKDGANYTQIGQFTRDPTCDSNASKNVGNTELIQSGPNHQKQVNTLQTLSQALFPAGALQQRETLWLAIRGPLEGKYLYEKILFLAMDYLKMCSSLIGYNYVTTRSAQLLISNQLDLNALISPTGAYDLFRKGCTTVCSGMAYFFA